MLLLPSWIDLHALRQLEAPAPLEDLILPLLEPDAEQGRHERHRQDPDDRPEAKADGDAGVEGHLAVVLE